MVAWDPLAGAPSPATLAAGAGCASPRSSPRVPTGPSSFRSGPGHLQQHSRRVNVCTQIIPRWWEPCGVAGELPSCAQIDWALFSPFFLPT